MALLNKKAEETRDAQTSLADDIYKTIFESKKQVEDDKVAQKIVLSGENGLGKTSLALTMFTSDLKEDECVIYIGIDNSGNEIINKFFKKELHSGQILTFNPDATTVNDRGASVKDEERVLENVTSTAAAVKKALENGIKVKGVIVDGVSFLLEFAESKMRMEKNIAPDGGTPTHVWKIRAKYFRAFTSAYMSLDIPVIFVTHQDFLPELVEPGKSFPAVKERLIDECGVRIVLSKKQSADNNHVEDYIAEVKKNRSDIFSVNKPVTFMSVNSEDSTVDTDYEAVKDLIFPSNEWGRRNRVWKIHIIFFLIMKKIH